MSFSYRRPCAPFLWLYEWEDAYSSDLDTFIFLLPWMSEPYEQSSQLLLFSWKEQRCGQKTCLVEYPFTPGRVKRGKGLGTSTGSQPFQFFNLFLHLQPVKRKHTAKYHERQHTFTAVFLRRAEMKFFTFSLVLLLKTRTKDPLVLVKPRFSPAFSWQ